MRRLSRLFHGPYKEPKRLAILPAVTPEESAAILERQLERSREMERAGTRVDLPGSAVARREAFLALLSEEERAERGTEEFPRRDGRIIEPLHHHRRLDRSRSMFLPAAPLASEME